MLDYISVKDAAKKMEYLRTPGAKDAKKPVDLRMKKISKNGGPEDK